jgi:hypothetical protein
MSGTLLISGAVMRLGQQTSGLMCRLSRPKINGIIMAPVTQHCDYLCQLIEDGLISDGAKLLIDAPPEVEGKGKGKDNARIRYLNGI